MLRPLQLNSVDFLARIYNAVCASPRKAIANCIPSGGVVLDIGCGTMWKSYLYVYLPLRQASIVGLERFSGATIYGANALPPWISQNRDFTLLTCDVDSENIPFPDSSIDGIFLSHVIEHVQDRTRLLGEVFRVLKQGGVLYIETPGNRSLLVPAGSRLNTGANPYPYNYYDDASHLGTPMTLQDLRRALEDSGMTVTSSGFHREFGRLAMPIYLALFLLSFLPGLPDSAKGLMRGFAWWNMVGWPIYALAKKA